MNSCVTAHRSFKCSRSLGTTVSRRLLAARTLMLPSTRAWPNRACPISLLFSSNLCDGSTQSLEPSAASTAILYNILCSIHI